MSVLNCLAELHQEPGLKLTLKFEVEVLCKALNIDLKVKFLKLSLPWLHSNLVINLFCTLGLKSWLCT